MLLTDHVIVTCQRAEFTPAKYSENVLNLAKLAHCVRPMSSSTSYTMLKERLCRAARGNVNEIMHSNGTGTVITFANQKGGCGKSTTVVNVGAILSWCQNMNVLLVDMDPQANTTSGVGIIPHEVDTTVYNVLLTAAGFKDMRVGPATAEEAIIRTAFPNLDILPSNLYLARAESELQSVVSRETLLKRALNSIKSHYDYVLVDTPPSLGILTLNALVASDDVIVPVQAHFYAASGIPLLFGAIEDLRVAGYDVKVRGFLMTMVDNRTRLARDVRKLLRDQHGNLVFQTEVPSNIRLAEAPSHGKPVIFYDSRCTGAQAYQKLTEEMIS